MRTPLYDQHLALGAKFIDFCGWEMPLHYSQGILAEHHAVRSSAGIFDVSHMGRVAIEGPDAEALLDYLSTNKICGKPNYSAVYTVWCNERGGSVDDLIAYRYHAGRYFVIVNASNRAKDVAHLRHQAERFNVEIHECFLHEGILAVQGPQAKGLVTELFPAATSLKPMHFVETDYHGKQLIIAETGYTGAKGVELYVPQEILLDVWQALMVLGAHGRLVPVGLGARDTLRLEMGYALYGHELNEDIAPTESVAAWTVKLDKGDFLGKEALVALQKSQHARHACGIVLTDPGVARENYEVYHEGTCIGRVTSGTHSPTLNQSVALILTDSKLQLGDQLQIKIRQRFVNAAVSKLPFI